MDKYILFYQDTLGEMSPVQVRDFATVKELTSAICGLENICNANYTYYAVRGVALTVRRAIKVEEPTNAEPTEEKTSAHSDVNL